MDGGAGDDQIHTGGVFSELSGGPGADLLDATGSLGAAVSYEDHTDGVTVRLNGVADDGSPGEGDNVLGPVTSDRPVATATTGWRPAPARAPSPGAAATTC